jgi:hypothetical protein
LAIFIISPAKQVEDMILMEVMVVAMAVTTAIATTLSHPTGHIITRTRHHRMGITTHHQAPQEDQVEAVVEVEVVVEDL